LGVIVGKLLKIPIPYDHQGLKLTFKSLTYESDEEMKGGWSIHRRVIDTSRITEMAVKCIKGG